LAVSSLVSLSLLGGGGRDIARLFSPSGNLHNKDTNHRRAHEKRRK